jgi:glycosyltransferase involved in cell wall biosynthesis
MRLACVGHGDHREALRRLASGEGETYHAQRHSIDALGRLASGAPLLVVSLDAPADRTIQGDLELVGIGEPPAWRRRPRRLFEAWRIARVREALEHFRPTHVLLRSMDVVGCAVLEWTTSRNVPSAAIVAGRFQPGDGPSLRFCALANHPSVAFVGNHNRIATESLVACGLAREKAIAWDWPPAVTPDGKPPRTLAPGEPLRLVFAGSLLEAKGVRELVDAVGRAAEAGVPVHLEMLGDGPEEALLARHPATQAGLVTLRGRCAHPEVLEEIARSQLAVVPSRASFPEGLPIFIYESLALRVPVVLSDHPVFTSYFRDGEGVAFARASDPASLARTIVQLHGSPERYARLSEATLHAWRAIQCEVSYEDLMQRLARRWKDATCTS